ncbi:MAG TPA: cytochrome D1 domain-containing protein [Candidatus Deferrimicrobiaceae bacterium]
MTMHRYPAFAGLVMLLATLVLSAEPPPTFAAKAPAKLTITSNSLRDGNIGVAYSQALTAKGGSGPGYTWSIPVGTLPPGLTLDGTTGVISGTPTTAGKYDFTAQVTDSAAGIATKDLSITVKTKLAVSTTGLPGGMVSLPYTATLVAAGGTPPYTWSISVPPIPDGVTLDPATGIISGSPTLAGAFNFTVQVVDSRLVTATSALSINVVALTGDASFNAKCVICHGQYGAGGYALTNIQKMDVAFISSSMTLAPTHALATSLAVLPPAESADIATYLAYVPPGTPLGTPDIVQGETAFRQNCTYCHGFGKPGQVAMDLMAIPEMFPANPGGTSWVAGWIDSPPLMVAAGGFPPAELATFPYLMPDLPLTPTTIWNIVKFFENQNLVGPLTESVPKTLTAEEFEATKQVYFNRCAGCHGLHRKGGTGPVNDDVRSKVIGTDGIGAILRNGTPRGMPNFGQVGILTEAEIANLQAYMQLPPPEPPPWTMTDIQASWNLIVPVEARPTAPQHTRNWQNFTGVILRDSGQVAIIDGDSNEEVVRLKTGFAIHILRASSSGRYYYAIGRDGLVSMIDLWTAVPTIVATVKGGIDARSVESSKFPGYEDKYLIEGCYWPPQYVVFDGLTLEPIQRVDIPMVDIYGVPLVENRIAAIVSSRNNPVWALCLKESGHVGIVDYSDPAGLNFPLVSTIPAAKFMHDGGFDHTGNYFLAMANASNQIVVINLQTQTREAIINSGLTPHPGRGVNWQDPEFGWVNASPHLGEGMVTVYGADPAARPDVAWTVVRSIPLPSAGSLFIKSHPNSPWILVDMTMSATGYEKSIAVIDKRTGALDRIIPLTANGRLVHFEFNMSGTEVWVSDWAPDGAVIVLDSQTLAEIRRYPLPSPTGKFNVYNTTHDVY